MRGGLAGVVLVLALATVMPVAHSQDLSLKSVLEGSGLPLTIKAGSLTAEWRAFQLCEKRANHFIQNQIIGWGGWGQHLQPTNY
jgi:hypothetical protein